MYQFVNFFPNQQPPLLAGKYTVNVSQETRIQGCDVEDANFEFTVWSEQIAMNPSVVYSVYPPRSSSADYKSCLPHIVLNRKSLPWEKQLFKGDKETPRVCLLVFSDDEGVAAYSGTYQNAIAAENGIFVPDLKNSRLGSDDEPCIWIDIPYRLFSEVLPLKEELKYLAHVKMAALDDKVTDKDVKNGWFSCVVSNRYPKSSVEPVRHTAHLVSLEGFEQYLSNRKTENVDNKYTIRMFSLSSWEFFCSPGKTSFFEDARQLNVGAFMHDSEQVKDVTIQKMIRLGYCAMNHNMRDGSQTVSWYRPPLLPLAPNIEENIICKYADSLLKYDPELGMYDISYQTAWQLGRLLAFSDKKFAKELIAWRLGTKKRLTQIQAENAVLSKLDSTANDSANPLVENWLRIASSLIEECGKDDFTNLNDTGMPDFSRICDRTTSSDSVEFTQQDLFNLYD